MLNEAISDQLVRCQEVGQIAHVNLLIEKFSKDRRRLLGFFGAMDAQQSVTFNISNVLWSMLPITYIFMRYYYTYYVINCRL